MAHTFSQRLGITPIKLSVQIGSMDQDLRNGLWNALHDCYFSGLQDGRATRPVADLLATIWDGHIKGRVNEIPHPSRAYQELSEGYAEYTWNQVYDFVDFVVANGGYVAHPEAGRTRVNAMLEREVAGYRFVAGVLAPISSQAELDAIEAAVNATRTSGMGAAAVHLDAALRFFADRQAPDYRNSVKESISAVESVAVTIAGTPTASLGDALKVLASKIAIHPALLKGFQALYGYTSEHGGIRHALLDTNETVDATDARYMLVSCSAFVHFLIEKGGAAGLLHGSRSRS